MATITPDLRDIKRAIIEARDLDISLSNAGYYLHRGSKMRKRIVSMLESARDIRNDLYDLEKELGAADGDE